MDKSLFSVEYELFLQLLRQARQTAGLTQGDLAHRLGRNQSFVSKYERGERRVDVVELRTICLVLEISLQRFVDTLDEMISRASGNDSASANTST